MTKHGEDKKVCKGKSHTKEDILEQESGKEIISGE